MSNSIDDRPQTTSAGVLLEILSEMVHQMVDFALLCDRHSDPLDTSSDIDLVFAQNPRQVIEPILTRMQDSGRILVVQRLHYEVPFGYYYIVKTHSRDTKFLHLDCLHDPWGIGRYHLTSTYLLEGKEKESWGYRTSRQREPLYLLMKRAIKGDVTSEGLQSLKQSVSDGQSDFWSEVERWFGPKSRVLVDRLFAAQSCRDTDTALLNLRRTLEHRFRFRHPLRYLVGLGLTVLRQLRRFLKPTGLFVVVVGPDGSGKSTVSDFVLRDLERAFRRTWRFHWRPGLLRKLGRIAGPVAAESPIPPETSKYRGFVSLARFIYYWLDFVIGYWVIIYPIMARTGLVISERYFPDVLVTPARYGFAVPRPLMRLAARLVPSPDLVILLKGEPEAIHLRKPELSPDEIAALTQRYEDEIQRWGKHVVISTGEGAAAVAAKISNLILKERAAKTASQIGWTA